MLPHFFKIVEQVDPPTPQPFIILEIYPTSDGMRTRVAEVPLKTFDEARHEVNLRREKLKRAP
jgi:hypothetical protein